MTATPSAAEIGESQNLDANLDRKLASGWFYRRAKWLHFAGWAVAVAFALASPVVLLLKPDLGPMLGAIAGGWIFLSRFLLEPFKAEFQLKGVKAQEQFDCSVLGIEWNSSLARALPGEEIRRASKARKDVEALKSWYPTDAALTWPRSVLVCQRSNAVWARRQHRTFGWALIVAAAAWAVIGILVAIFDSATLAAYLTTIALPSLPALLDASEMARRHRQGAASRELIEEQTDNLFEIGGAAMQELREIQDQLFALRRDEPLVPEWFYKLIRDSYEDDMKYAADQLAS